MELHCRWLWKWSDSALQKTSAGITPKCNWVCFCVCTLLCGAHHTTLICIVISNLLRRHFYFFFSFFLFNNKLQNVIRSPKAQQCSSGPILMPLDIPAPNPPPPSPNVPTLLNMQNQMTAVACKIWISQEAVTNQWPFSWTFVSLHLIVHSREHLWSFILSKNPWKLYQENCQNISTTPTPQKKH